MPSCCVYSGTVCPDRGGRPPSPALEKVTSGGQFYPFLPYLFVLVSRFGVYLMSTLKAMSQSGQFAHSGISESRTWGFFQRCYSHVLGGCGSFTSQYSFAGTESHPLGPCIRLRPYWQTCCEHSGFRSDHSIDQSTHVPGAPGASRSRRCSDTSCIQHQ